MLGLILRDEFWGKGLKGTAIELSNETNTGATQIAVKEFLKITYPTHDQYSRHYLMPLPNGGYPMINYELQHDKGILVLHPEGPLEAADFISITSQVDTYLAGHGKLHGVLIHAKSFPGWKNFAAMLAHLKFLKEHIQKIEKVAVVADGALANIMPNIANHFVHAQVQHFDFVREDAAWDWLNQTGNAQMNPVA